MTTATLKRDKHIVEVLEKVKNLYRGALDIDYEKEQRLIMEYLILISKINPEMEVVKEACQKVLIQYPKGMPHDSDLLSNAKDLVQYPHRNLFPKNSFEEDMIIFRMYGYLIKELFDSISKEELKRPEQLIVERLHASVRNLLVDNQNFKGVNPYYHRNYSELTKAKKLWLELLDNDYSHYIDYFNEEDTSV